MIDKTEVYLAPVLGTKAREIARFQKGIFSF